jgi:hypothetical protein
MRSALSTGMISMVIAHGNNAFWGGIGIQEKIGKNRGITGI